MTAEWRHVTDHFHAFIGNLQPTPLDRRRALAAAAEVAACLRQQFRPGAPSHFTATGRPGWPVDDYMLTGGYGKGTAVRPMRAVDMLYVLPDDLRPPAGGLHPLIASMAGAMSAALAPTFATCEQPDENWLSVRSFADVEVHLIACFRTGCDTLVMADPRCPGGWTATNPAAEKSRLRAADLASGGKATHLIMMLKAWRRSHGVAIVSLALELLVAEFVLAWIYPRRSLLFYDWMVRDFFFWLVHQAHRDLLTPGALESLHLGDTWVEDAAHAYGRARRACERERDNEDTDATHEWRQIFGPDFPGAATAARLPAPVRQGGIATLPGWAAPER